jgi:hypothetical protein
MACFAQALPRAKKNLAVLVAVLRRAAGPTVPIVGLTYPDVFLGLYTQADRTDKADAVASVAAFRRLLNPTLKAAFATVDGDFEDVTRATGAYVTFGHTTHTVRYGTIPVAVADVCALTSYCRIRDVHPTTPGYTVIAKLIVQALPKHHRQSAP